MTEYNKVVYDGQTLIDLTQDDVQASDVRSGVYFHSADGVRSQGTLSIGMTVEDISDKITFGGAWSNYMRKAYLIGGKFVFFTLEGYASTIMAGTQYTIATIASGYRPKDNLAFTGHATDANYLPQSTVNCYVWTSGDITVRCSNGNGNYVFISCWYALA